MYRGFNLDSCSFTDPNIAPGATTFPASTAFFVRHGFIGFLKSLSGQDQGAFLGSNTNFELYVDGVEQRALPDFYGSQGGDFFVKLFVFNFADGMTGTHVFVGWWFEDAGLEGGTYGTELFVLGCALSVQFV